ncbi:MAG: ABC transporter permease [Granulosicoccus sp.]|nr:ABC transporter permease [Granulosicoccus sp.]
MNGLKGILVVVGLVAGVLSLATGIWQVPLQLGFVLTALLVLLLYWRLWPANPLVFSLCLAVLSTAGAWSSLHTLSLESLGVQYWSSVVLAWSVAWLFVEQLSDQHTLNRWLGTALRIVIPLVFGVWLLVLWEIFTRGMNVPQVLLPSPSLIADRFASSIPILWADFKQTFLKAVLIGYAMGCGAGFFVAILIDRSPFLQRGLLPVGNLVSALPIVGVAPIMVMWFGFDWPSKAAVVVVMTFFPMLVNTVSGLAAAGTMQKDLMKSYAANYWQTLFKLRLPEALPFIFNALKINSTLALIGAIVAEFFGTPIVGMGFRISTEVGRMNVDMVWAEIAVAALAGSLFYGLIALVERAMTFWHPSVRGRT